MKTNNATRPTKNLRVFGLVLIVVGGFALEGGITGHEAAGHQTFWIVFGSIFVLFGLLAIRLRVPESYLAENRRQPTSTYGVVGYDDTVRTFVSKRSLASHLGSDLILLALGLWAVFLLCGVGLIIVMVILHVLSASAVLLVLPGTVFLAISIVLVVRGLTMWAHIDPDGLRWRQYRATEMLWSRIARIELGSDTPWHWNGMIRKGVSTLRVIWVVGRDGTRHAIRPVKNSGFDNEVDFTRVLLGRAHAHEIPVEVSNCAAWARVLRDVAPSLLVATTN